MPEIDFPSIVVFIVSILLVMLIIYIATRLVTREEVLTSSYIIRLFVVSFVVVILVPFLSSFLGNSVNLGTTGQVLAVIMVFLILVVILKYVLVVEVSLGNEWAEAVAISLLTIVFIALFNIGLSQFGLDPLFSVF
ncbi:MAG: hypothetical protein KAI64_00210 [Thermoplasmata archaeon]|nr:hypothetical protein [Thermoplasmata archaeon]